MQSTSFYRELPPPDLDGGVRCVWVRRVGEGEPPVRVLPDACVDLVWQQGHGAFLAGPDTGPHLAHSPPGTVFVGLRFRPGAGGPALGLRLDVVRDQRVDAGDLARDLDSDRGPHRNDRLIGALDPDLAPAEALARLTEIATRIRGSHPDRAVEAATAVLADPTVRTSSLARDLGLSERQLRRRFHAAVGYGPKTLQRVLRFQRFLSRLTDPPADGIPDLAELAFEAGYADQSHLTRDCGALAGLTPAALAATRRRPSHPHPAPDRPQPVPVAAAPHAHLESTSQGA